MPPSSWKRAESRLAKFFHSERTPLSGSCSKHTSSDSLHPVFYLESKYGQTSLVRNLWSLFQKTARLARREKKIPILGIQQRGKKGILLVIHSNDFEKVFHQYLNDKYHDNIKISISECRGMEVGPNERE